MEPVHAVRSFQPETASVAEARRFVIDTVAPVAVDPRAIELLTGELAANAVLHAQSEYRVRVRADTDRVRVEVVNDAPEMVVSVREPSDDGGRGLHMVRALAADWGTESSPDEKVVWFEMRIGQSSDASVDA